MILKKLPLAFVFLFALCPAAFAQGNLQFNQAIKLDITGGQNVGAGSLYTQIASQVVTVPAGKVWKIESVNSNLTKGTYSTSTYQFLINYGGIPIVYMDDAIISASLVNTGVVIPHQIYWLPAGTHTFSMWCPNVGTPVTFTYTTTITAIEFNVVP